MIVSSFQFRPDSIAVDSSAINKNKIIIIIMMIMIIIIIIIIITTTTLTVIITTTNDNNAFHKHILFKKVIIKIQRARICMRIR